MEHFDFYQQLRRKIDFWLSSDEGKRNKFADVVLLAPDLFHLLIKLTLDKNVPLKEKAILGIAVAYFLSPVDLIPEIITGPIGFLDDIALAAYALNRFIQSTDKEIVQKHWAGNGDILELIKKILDQADQMIGRGLWDKLKNLIDKKS